MLIRIVIIGFLAFGTLIGCKKDKEIAAFDFQTSYAGLKEGNYVIYSAKKIVHDDVVNVHDTSSFLLKTVIGKAYIDNSGRTANEFLRYRSNDNGLTWNVSDLWTAILDNNKYQLVEENQRLVKLIFAPSLNKEWDINIFNSFGEKNANYSAIHKNCSINGLLFDSTVTVEQADFFSLVDYQKQYEVYAKNIGLVQTYYKDLIIENFDTLRAIKGNELFLNVLSFGVE